MSDLLLIGGFWQCYCVEIEKKKSEEQRGWISRAEDEFEAQEIQANNNISGGLRKTLWLCVCRQRMFECESRALRDRVTKSETKSASRTFKLMQHAPEKAFKKKTAHIFFARQPATPPKSNDKLGCFLEPAWRHVYPVVKLSITTLSNI